MQAELGDRRLLIVPDGALHYVPFEALPVPEPNAPASESGIPIIAKHEVIKLASAAVLVAVQRENTRASKTIIVLADPVFSTADERLPRHLQSIAAGAPNSISPPADNSRGGDSPFISRLPSTRREGEEIVKLLPTADGKLVSDFDANLPFALSAELSQYRVIHLATHGMINVEHPELSGVVLSLVDREGKQQDGFLRLHEIYNLNLNADLVVLSACQTGLGKDYKGEGLIGLTRGFMYAGSKGVIATLWKVDEEATTELMKHFYDGLFRQGLTPAAALRAAKLAIRNQKRWQSPFFWAAFELHGEYAKPIGAEGRNFRIYIVLALLLISFVAIYYVWKNFRRQRQTN
jgi:CHAT domain-containing protein